MCSQVPGGAANLHRIKLMRELFGEESLWNRFTEG